MRRYVPMLVSLLVVLLLLPGLLSGCSGETTNSEGTPGEETVNPVDKPIVFEDQLPDPDALRVAVFVGYGSSADKILATMRALQGMGFYFCGIDRSDIKQGRLITDNYDVLLIPSGKH